MTDWLYQIGKIALEAVDQSGPPVLIALFLVTFLGELAVPFPWLQDIIFYYIGFQLGRSSIRAIPITLVMLSGRIAGSAAPYWTARLMGTPLIDRIGRRFKSFPRRVDSIKVRLSKHTIIAMMSVRLMPGILPLSSIAAGIIGLSYWDFVLGITLASVVDDGTTILSGFITRLTIEYLGIEPTPWLFSIGVFVTMVMVWLVPWIYFRARNRKKKDQAALTRPDNAESKAGIILILIGSSSSRVVSIGDQSV